MGEHLSFHQIPSRGSITPTVAGPGPQITCEPLLPSFSSAGPTWWAPYYSAVIGPAAETSPPVKVERSNVSVDDAPGGSYVIFGSPRTVGVHRTK